MYGIDCLIPRGCRLFLLDVNADCLCPGPAHHRAAAQEGHSNAREATLARGRLPTVRTAPSLAPVQRSEMRSTRQETVRCSRSRCQSCIYMIWNTFVTSAKHISNLLPIQVDLYYY